MFKNLLYSVYEKLIILFIILLIMISFSYQVIINNKVISNRVGFNYSNLEKISDNFTNIDKGIISFRIKNHNKYYNTQVLINGEFLTDFSNSDEVSIFVYNNDIIDINGSMYNASIVVDIFYKSDNIISSNIPPEIIINNNMVTVGKVKLN